MIYFFVAPALILLFLLVYTRPPTAVILISALLPTYLIRLNFFGLSSNFFELAVILIFILVVIQQRAAIFSKPYPVPPPLVTGTITLFIFSAIVSVFISPNLRTSLGVLKGWVVVPLLCGWLVYFFAIKDQTKNFLYNIIRSLLLSGVTVSLLGLFQLRTVSRVSSVYDVPNSLALFISPLIVLSFCLAVHRQKTLFNWTSFIIMSLALLATQSVSGMVAVATSLFISAFLFPPRATDSLPSSPSSTKITVFVLCVFIFTAFVSLAWSGRLSYLVQPLRDSRVHNSLSVRRQLWSVSLSIIKDHPLFGVGLGAFEPAYQTKLHQRFKQYQENCLPSFRVANGQADSAPLLSCRPPIPEFVFRDPHNWLLSFWLNLGLLGLLSFSFLNFLIIYQATHQSTISPTNRQVFIIKQGLLIALVSILVFGLTDTIYWKNDLAAVYWLIFVLILSQTNTHHSQ